jgi:peptidoglycan/xylan/chitin deacetylase (PgdA/CDA1 family)
MWPLRADSTAAPPLPAVPVPAKTVVLTFDDAVKSQVTIVAPLLKKLGFHATFFITQAWMSDREHFMSWEDVADLHRQGFEIGNHSWTHSGFNTPKEGAALGKELVRVERELARVGVPKPLSFAWCGNAFGPEGVEQLRKHGYLIARRGMQPEQPYGVIKIGPALDTARYHPLLVPTTGDAYPDWNLEHFKKVLANAAPGEVVVLQFHGVPDVVHPWVNTPPERFQEYMQYLHDNGYRTLALRELLQYYDAAHLPEDAMLDTRYPAS